MDPESICAGPVQPYVPHICTSSISINFIKKNNLDFGIHGGVIHEIKPQPLLYISHYSEFFGDTLHTLYEPPGSRVSPLMPTPRSRLPTVEKDLTPKLQPWLLPEKNSLLVNKTTP